MHITIIGTGFVGVVSAAVFASLGNTVTGLDIDPHRIASLQKGKVPFFEPGLEELLVKTQETGNLSFTTSYEEAIPKADLVIIAVGTPSKADGQADLSYVYATAKSMAPHLKDEAIVAIKSTVPPGTCEGVEKKIQEARGPTSPRLRGASKRSEQLYVVSLPEFLREGTAVEDTLHPDRIVIGANEPEAIEALTELHKPFQAPVIVMKPESAQMCKYTANAYLATRITFINQIANLCEANGASISEVIQGIGFDKRIGTHYWYPGLGYGGSCFPKDVKELAVYAASIGQEDNLMVTVNTLNEERMPSLMKRFEKTVGGWEGKKVAVLGLSFKPNTDDMREAPSTKLIPYLLKHKAIVHAYDPKAGDAARQWFQHQDIFEGDAFRIENSLDGTLAGADIVMLVVEWKELVSLDLNKVAENVKPNAWFIDLRNQYNPKDVRSAKMRYIGIGRS